MKSIRRILMTQWSFLTTRSLNYSGEFFPCLTCFDSGINKGEQRHSIRLMQNDMKSKLWKLTTRTKEWSSSNHDFPDSSTILGGKYLARGEFKLELRESLWWRKCEMEELGGGDEGIEFAASMFRDQETVLWMQCPPFELDPWSLLEWHGIAFRKYYCDRQFLGAASSFMSLTKDWSRLEWYGMAPWKNYWTQSGKYITSPQKSQKCTGVQERRPDWL